MAGDPKKADSVFDFLYIDLHRISLFQSQFSQYGNLTSLVKGATSTKSTEGGVSVGLGKVGVNSEGEKSLEQHYDAQWVAPLAFLEEAADRKMILRSLKDARVGNLVLIKGRLSIRDLSLVKSALALQSVKRKLAAGVAIGTSVQRREKREFGFRDGISFHSSSYNPNSYFRH
jgi:hypothetical protein